MSVPCGSEWVGRQHVAASGVPLLCSLLETITGPAARARVRRGVTRDDAVARTLAEHRSNLDALEYRDPVTARLFHKGVSA